MNILRCAQPEVLWPLSPEADSRHMAVSVGPVGKVTALLNVTTVHRGCSYANKHQLLTGLPCLFFALTIP